MSRPRRDLTWTVLRTELRQLLRDRRALFAAVVLPVLLYPLLLGGTQKMEDAAQEGLAERDLVLHVDLAGTSPDTAAALRAALEGPHTSLGDVDASALLEVRDSYPPAHRASLRRSFEALTDGGRTAVVRAVEPEGPQGSVAVQVFARRKDPLSREASSRARSRLEEWGRAEGEARRLELLPLDPAAALAVEAQDVATEEDQGGRDLGRLLPILLVFLLVSGGSYGALTVFAAEREAGTLETLLTTPADRGAVVRGKFLCVLAATVATLLSNLLGLALAALLGTSDLPGGALGPSRLLGMAVFLPALVLLTAVLCLACGRARSFRQGQQLLFPLTLALVVPTTVVLVPDLEHSIALGLVPLAGAALSLRDALRGALEVGDQDDRRGNDEGEGEREQQLLSLAEGARAPARQAQHRGQQHERREEDGHPQEPTRAQRAAGQVGGPEERREGEPQQVRQQGRDRGGQHAQELAAHHGGSVGGSGQ